MQSDPGRLYGLPSLFAAEGGRVGAQEGGPISGITDMINQSIDEMQDNLGQQIQSGFTTQETIVPTETQDVPAGTQNNLGSVLGGQSLGAIQRPSPGNPGIRPLSPNREYGMFGPRDLVFPGGPGGIGPRVRPRRIPLSGQQLLGRPGISSLFGFAEGGMATAPGMPPGMQVDGRRGTFIPMGVKEKADDVPAMLSKNEFVMTADAVKAAGGGSVNKGAQRMYDLMNSLEAMV